MIEQTVTIATGDGDMPVFVTHPEEDLPVPAVIFYMDALGMREELRDMARRLGTVGYCVLLANLFYRDGGPSFDPKKLPEVDPRMNELNQALTHDKVLADTRAMLDFLDGFDAADKGPRGCVGYCMGGRHAYAAAAHFADDIGAAASLHGGFQVTDRPDSAHLQTHRIRGEIYFGFAEKDHLAPPEHIAIIEQALKAHAITHRIEIHPDTLHGFTFAERYCHHKQASERVWERLFALFRRRLGARAGA